MRRITKKQEGFLRDFLDTGNGTQAALCNYNIKGKNKENIAASIAKENLRKPQIKDMLEMEAKGALSRILELSKGAENEAVRLSANRDILDRAGYRPIGKHEVKAEIKEVPQIIGMTVTRDRSL